MHHYNIALLDGDLLIIAPALSETYMSPAPALTEQQEHAISAMAHRLHRREMELPQLMQVWSE